MLRTMLSFGVQKTSFQILRDVNHIVAHSFQFIDDVHIINACLIILVTVLDVFNFSIAEDVSETVDSEV